MLPKTSNNDFSRKKKIQINHAYQTYVYILFLYGDRVQGKVVAQKEINFRIDSVIIQILNTKNISKKYWIIR